MSPTGSRAQQRDGDADLTTAARHVEHDLRAREPLDQQHRRRRPPPGPRQPEAAHLDEGDDEGQLADRAGEALAAELELQAEGLAGDERPGDDEEHRQADAEGAVRQQQHAHGHGEQQPEGGDGPETAQRAFAPRCPDVVLGHSYLHSRGKKSGRRLTAGARRPASSAPKGSVPSRNAEQPTGSRSAVLRAVEVGAVAPGVSAPADGGASPADGASPTDRALCCNLRNLGVHAASSLA